MTRTPGPRQRRAARRRGAIALVAAALCLLSVGGVGVTRALWKDAASRPGDVLTHGNLDLVDRGAITWVETTPGVATPRSGTGLTGASGLDGFAGTAGDTVEVRYRVRSVLVGDNISAVVRASLTSTAPAGVSVGGYRVLSTAGVALAPASGYQSLGTGLSVGGLSATGDLELLIAVRIAFTVGPSYTSDVTGTSLPAPSSIALRFALEQVRTGTGFTS